MLTYMLNIIMSITIELIITTFFIFKNRAVCTLEVLRLYNKVYVFQVILPYFLAAIKPYIEPSWTDDVGTAWTALFDIILYYMTSGELIPDTNRNGSRPG